MGDAMVVDNEGQEARGWGRAGSCRARWTLAVFCVVAMAAMWSSGRVIAQTAAKTDVQVAAALYGDLQRMSEEVWKLLGAGNLQHAVRVGEEAVALAARHVGADDPLATRARSDLAGAYHDLGRPDEALALYQEVLAVRERTLGAEHPDTLSTRHNIAGAYRGLGRLDEAVALYQEVLAVRERTLGAEHPDTLSMGDNLARAYLDVGRLDEALALSQEVLAVQERTLGAEHYETLRTRHSLAVAYSDLGRLDEALALFREVLAVQERTRGAEHYETLSTRNSLAVAYRDLGRLNEALALFQEVLAVRERTQGAEHPETLRARNNLAGVYRDLDRLDEALALFREVLVVRERTLGTEHPSTLHTRNSLAVAYRDLGRLDEALALFREVLVVRERTLGAEHPDTLHTRHNLAGVYRDLDRLDEALALFREVLVVRERTLGGEHPDTLITREALAAADYAQGDLHAALAGWRLALRLRNAREARLAATMGEAGRRAVTRGNSSDGVLMSAALQTGDTAIRRLAATARVTRHARSHEGVGAQLASARRGGQGARVDTLAALQREYERLSNAEVPNPSAIRAAGQRIDQLWSELASAGLAAGVDAPEGDPLVALEATWRALAPGEALAHLVQYRPFYPRQTGLAQQGAARYAVFVLRGGDDPTGAPAFIDLGPATTLDEVVARFHGILMGGVAGNVLRASHAVYDRLVRPLRPLLGGATTVFVVSDGATAQVPWHALVTSMDGGAGGLERYLMDEGLTVLTLSSARELLRTLPPPGDGAPLVMAPFAGVPERQNGLPGTAREAQAVAAMLGVSPRMTLDASYGALRAAAETAPRVLHLATHGYAETDRGSASPLSFVGLRFAAGDGEGARVSASRMAVELPLLGTDLVVLSACESGLGAVQPGQDIASTRQAFHIAGARHVLASLWPVDDAAAAFFMERFYTHVQAGVGVVQAHSRALRETRDHGRRRDGSGGPYSAIEQWAPFALSVVPARGRE